MHPFITQLHNQQGAWTPPPPAIDPDWLVALENAPEESKANIANSWLWFFNKEWRTEQVTGQKRWFASYYKMYVKVSPYIDPALHHKYGLHGRYEDLLQLNREGTWDGFPKPMANFFVRVFKNCWYDPTADKRVAFEKMLWALEHYSIEEMKPVKQFIPLLFTVMWDEVANHPSEDTHWVECATRISVIAGLSATGFETVPNNSSINYSDGFGWFKLAQTTKARNGVSSGAHHRENALVAVHNCPPEVSLRCLQKILAKAIEKKTDTISWILERTFFNPGNAPIDDFYGVLRTWAPTYTKIWDSAEALGVPYTEAIEQALHSKPQAVMTEALPSDFSSDTHLGI